MESGKIKQVLYDMGADLCGIASIDRFDGAPAGYHPRDVFPACESVVVFAKKFPAATLLCNTTVPYTITRNILSRTMDDMSVQFCGAVEEYGIAAVPTGTISHSQYDKNTGRRRSIVSAKHCAVAAGLGRLGRNTLVITPQYGNMVWLNAILTDAVLEPDEMLPGNPCGDNCSICIDVCPVQAVGNPEMNQSACRGYAFRIDEGEEFTFKCHLCRTRCPRALGSENRHLQRRG